MTRGTPNDDLRREFMAELQTWIDLPEHPNLVTCRSFVAGDEVLIFADYVPGGSLQKWIDSGQLYEGGQNAALKRILDVAIQFAWGLRCLHELGIVHQDVKPGNVMISQESVETEGNILVKVADYGVSRVKASFNADIGMVLPKSNLVSGGGGFTDGYASPEQLEKRKLDWRTDLWSWGISVLQMFYGRLPGSRPGEFPEKLQELVGHGTVDRGVCEMPTSMATILSGCFWENPAQRWKSMDTVIDRLKEAFRTVSGTEYLSPLLPISNPETPYSGISERRTRNGRVWRNPREVLLWALQEAGRANDSLGASKVRPWSKREGQLTADIAVFDEARTILEGLVQGGRKDLEKELAALCVETGLVLETADDCSTAINQYKKAVEIYKRLIDVSGRAELVPELAKAYLYLGNSLSVLGATKVAIQCCAKAIKIYDQLVSIEKRSEFEPALAMAWFYAAESLVDTDDKLKMYDEAIRLHERLVYVEKHTELERYLSRDYLHKAEALISSPYEKSGERQQALSLLEKAIPILERLVVADGRREFSPDLAMAFSGKARALRRFGNFKNALPFSDKAILIFDRLVRLEGRSEFSSHLAMANLGKAMALEYTQEPAAAQILFDQAIEVLERLVILEGRNQFVMNLAESYYCRGLALKKGFVQQFDKAITIIDYLVNVANRKEFLGDLAIVYGGKAQKVYESGDLNSARKIWEKAIEILERLVLAEGRTRFSYSLAAYYCFKAETLEGGQSIELYDKAIAMIERLAKSEGYKELAPKLNKIKEDRALVLKGKTGGKRKKHLWF
ncbi:MAG: protein kinase domain-containing protein [Elusimicrobiales bacterium]